MRSLPDTNKINSGVKRHILLTNSPVVKSKLKQKHPELYEEFEDGSFICGIMPKSDIELLSLASEPNIVVIVASDDLYPDQIAMVCSVLSKSSRGFYVYSKRQRSLEYVSKDLEPGKDRAIIR